MPTSPTDSVTSIRISYNQSDKDFTAETASETVMAEQIGHNVVNNTESMSASPLVDVAANQNTTEPAKFGTKDQQSSATDTDNLQTTRLVNKHAIHRPALNVSADAEIQATDQGAEPSAGDAPDGLTKLPGSPTEQGAFSTGTTGQEQYVNGLHDARSGSDGLLEDAHLREDSVDVSVHSDTEGSGVDGAEAQKDEKHHIRTNSVKKPTTFSKVSVTKNFLAKSATATPSIAKPSDKPIPVGTPPQHSAAKPRLIAKTGASLRDIQKAHLGTDGSSGPDASKVWNKNRPVAPPPPRQFTDEELKQQYGIHLATRLQTDENGKDSKWADIDDDEDDWAPETVVWMDGTKSTLTSQEAASAEKEQKPALPLPPKAAEGVRPVLAIKKQTELGPMKTILKPGSGAAAVQAKQNGSAAGTPTDKPSLKAKSPAPAPAKSPWAALPPVEKVSPINPPVQPPQAPPFVTQDARAYEQQPPPPPAREIAADTFDRSWREGEGGTRELFNSANGRYEPVAETRRGSIKPDSSSRKPAVLQRPSQSAAAPAEPSPAFQTRSTSQMDGSWARRRGSSVSQGSIPPARRMSVTKGPEISPAPERRTSTVIGHDMRSSPRMARTELAQPMFSQQTAWQQQMPAQPEPGTEEEDPVKAQERIMKEKRELAKKRREEEEKRLEEEKQERLKARLASLANAGKSRKEREAEQATTIPRSSTEKPVESAIPAAHVTETSEQTAIPAEVSAVAANEPGPPSLPPAPEEALVKQISPEEVLPSPLPPRQQPPGLPDRSMSSTDQETIQQPRPHLSPRANARAPFAQQSTAYRAPASSYSSPGDRKLQRFGRSPLPNTDSFSTPWPTTAPNGNVWGTSGIGNGTFESANGFAPMLMSQQSSALPPPPGMGRPPQSARISPQSLTQESRSPNLQQQAVVEPHRSFAPPGFESRPDPFSNQGRTNGPSPVPVPGFGRPAHAPGPIAPPSRSQHQQQVQRHDPSGWKAIAESLPNEFASEVEAAGRKQSDAGPSVPREDRVKETFKKTSAAQSRLGAPRRFDQTEYTIHDAQGSRSVQSHSPAPPNAQTQPSGPFSTASPLQHDPWKQTVENTVRIPDGSLNPAHGGLPVHQPPIAPPNSVQPPHARFQGNVNSAANPLPPAVAAEDHSPPPPESTSHPVNSGETSRPLVKLPPGKPVVKLPPAPAPTTMQPSMSPQDTVMMPQRPISNWGAPGSHVPIVKQEGWQARFNTLFNRTPIQTETPPSPPKTPPKVQGPALAVTSSSRAVMDEAPVTSGATVSLPQAKDVVSSLGFTIDASDEVVSKPAIEHTFTEELSQGSKPKVTVPRNSVYANYVYNATPRAMLNTQSEEHLEAQSSHGFNMIDLHQKHAGIYVDIPQTKLIRRYIKHNTGNHKVGGPHRDAKPYNKINHQKGREASIASPVTNGSPSAGSRKASGVNGPQPALASSAGTSSPAAETKRKTSQWARPPKGPGAKTQRNTSV